MYLNYINAFPAVAFSYVLNIILGQVLSCILLLILLLFLLSGSSSEFLFNDKPVSQSVYTAELEKIGIIVKARNCLVFQVSIEGPKKST